MVQESTNDDPFDPVDSLSLDEPLSIVGEGTRARIVVGYTLFADTVSAPVVGAVSASLVGGIALVAVAAVWFAKQRRSDSCGCC